MENVRTETYIGLASGQNGIAALQRRGGLRSRTGGWRSEEEDRLELLYI